jgi:hypothetical protein
MNNKLNRIEVSQKPTRAVTVEVNYKALKKERKQTINKAHFCLHQYWCLRLDPNFDLEGKILRLSSDNYEILKSEINICALEMITNNFISEPNSGTLMEKHQKIINLMRMIFGLDMTIQDNNYLTFIQLN